jgi:membrane protein DedA with SNARE-associated domain
MMEWTSHLEPLVRTYGLFGLFLDVSLESLGLPLPGETLILVAAGLAAMGDLNIVAVGITAAVAAVVGDNIGYLIGRKFGRGIILSSGRRVGVTDERLRKVEETVQRHGPFIVAIARFFVILRQLNGIAAGLAGMSWPRFLVANAVGAVLWVGTWCFIAYYVGRHASILPFFWHHLSVAAMFAVAAVLLLLVVMHVFRRRRA